MSLLLVLLASQAIEPPLIGCLRESSAVVRCVYGVAGAFILGPAVANKAQTPTRAKNAALPDGTKVSLESEEIVVVRVDGRSDRVPAPAMVEAIEPIGNGWFHLVGTRRVMRVTADRADVFVLPRERRE